MLNWHHIHLEHFGEQMIKHIIGLFKNPVTEWQKIYEESCSNIFCYFQVVIILAAIPAISGFIGTTQIGWQIGAGPVMKLEVTNALTISIMYYFVMLVGVMSMSGSIYWMAKTYGAEQIRFSNCVALASYTPLPLFIVGIMELYPVLWLNFIIGLPALAYTVFLLYTGVPIMMNVSKERGFLFSSAVLAFGLTVFVGMLAITAILWGMGFAPAFTQ